MRREVRLRVIGENMALFGDLPEDYEDFTNNAVFRADNVLIYSTKDNEAYCTGCRQTTKNLKLFGKIKPKHNKDTVCPCCGRLLTAKSKGYMKNGYEVVRWSELIDRNEEKVLIRYVRHVRKYASDGSYAQESNEMLRVVIKDHEEKVFGLYSDGWAFRRKPMNWYGWSKYQEPVGDIMLYNRDIAHDLKGTVCQYSAIERMLNYYILPNTKDLNVADKHLRIEYAYLIEDYLVVYAHHPYLEWLVKVGFISLASDLVSYTMTWMFSDKGKSLNEVLGVSKESYKAFLEYGDPTENCVRNAVALEKENLPVTYEVLTDLEVAEDMGKYSISNYILCRKFMSHKKANKYLIAYGITYADYIDMAQQLKWNMKSKFILFPKDVQKAHDLAVELFNKHKAELLTKKMFEVDTKGIYSFENDKFVIVVPTGGKDLVNEGDKLHHCVASYTDKVINGETMILFVRRKKARNKPFYTMEWQNNRIIQCRGLKNCDMTPEVKKFVTDFETHMKQNIKKGA